MAEAISFVELAPDWGAPSQDDEALLTRRLRPPPVWLGRLAAASPRIRYAVALAVLVGGLLAADRAVGPISAPVARIAPAAGLVYADRGHCPIAVTCEVIGRPRQDMWAIYNKFFVDTTPSGGSVWYDPKSGVVYFQELDAMGTAGQTITLVEQRLIGMLDVSFGPTIDMSPDSRHGVPRTGRRSVIVTARSGPWVITASLTGPRDTLLPVAAAMHWAAVAPLPG